MRITFLGTGAANAFPEAFCTCANCEKARALGGPSLRKRSAALVNDDLLIDLGPDIKTAAVMHNCVLAGVRYCLQTHPHADHMDVSHLLTRSPGFGVVGASRLHLYASPATLQRAAETFQRDLEDYSFLDPDAEDRLNLQAHPVEPLHPFAVGNYRVIGFPANHAPGMGALLYSVESGGRSLFYGTDTAPLPEETWQGFHRHGLRFNLVILDHTYGPDEPASDHLSAHEVIRHAARMSEEGLLAGGARVLATHIAHEGNPPHPELAEFAARHGYGVAYDGMTVEV